MVLMNGNDPEKALCSRPGFYSWHPHLSGGNVYVFWPPSFCSAIYPANSACDFQQAVDGSSILEEI
jgi:hypothetical protein